MSKYQQISVSEAEELLYETDILLLDMRDFRAYLRGHHPRALHLQEQNLRALLKHSARSVPVLIYCEHGHRSQDMAQLFADFGFTSCYSLAGGYEAWNARVRRPDTGLSTELMAWLSLHDFSPRNLDQRNAHNETALMQTARAGEYRLARELVLAGAGLDLVNDDGNNALWMAVQSGSVAITQLLLNNDIQLDQQNDHGATALMFAASRGDVTLVSRLLMAGADIALTTVDDFSALDVAASRHILRLLQQHAPSHRYVA